MKFDFGANAGELVESGVKKMVASRQVGSGGWLFCDPEDCSEEG